MDQVRLRVWRNRELLVPALKFALKREKVKLSPVYFSQKFLHFLLDKLSKR